jgi:hypothetical protein
MVDAVSGPTPLRPTSSGATALVIRRGRTLRARELFIEQLDALGEFPHSQPGDGGQAVVVDPDPERRAGLTSSAGARERHLSTAGNSTHSA